MNAFSYLPLGVQYFMWADIAAAAVLAFAVFNHGDGSMVRPLFAAAKLAAGMYALFHYQSYVVVGIALSLWAYWSIWGIAREGRFKTTPDRLDSFIPPDGRHMTVDRGAVAGRTKNSKFLLLKDGTYLFTNKGVTPDQRQIDGIVYTWDQLVSERDKHAGTGFETKKALKVSRYGVYSDTMNFRRKAQEAVYRDYFSFLPASPPKPANLSSQRQTTAHQTQGTGAGRPDRIG